jgi:lipoprotein-anchoring transpeptidase ErfK/SrfK
MRCIGVTALLGSAFCGTALADPLQVTYPAYAVAQPVYVAQAEPQAQWRAQAEAASGQQYSYPYVPQTAPPAYTAAAPDYTGTVAPRYAPAPASGSNPGGGGFLEAIFGGPTIQAHVYQPGALPVPIPQTTVASAPAYAPSSQGDMANYPLDPKFERQVVDYRGEERAGTIIIDTPNKLLYLVEDGGKALRYGIGVGRPGFTWAGVKTISAKREWPDWRPPADMLARRPDLPRFMPGGVDNPLGARAMYLGSTLYRIHGSNEPWTIGTNVSSGCIRMRNEDVTDLYNRVQVGTKVVIL